MSKSNVVGSLLCFLLLSASVCGAQDLSVYRGFQFGAAAETISARLGMKASDLTTIHLKPALIEELEWTAGSSADSSANKESLQTIRFSFYNHELFKMVVTYDPAKTEGLTSADVIEAISGQYGHASIPQTEVTISSLKTFFPDKQKVYALWDNDQYSYSLFHRSFSGTFGLVIVSKSRDALANAAVATSVAQQKSDAAQTELQKQKQQESERQQTEENARLKNKPNFRP